MADKVADNIAIGEDIKIKADNVEIKTDDLIKKVQSINLKESKELLQKILDMMQQREPVSEPKPEPIMVNGVEVIKKEIDNNGEVGYFHVTKEGGVMHGMKYTKFPSGREWTTNFNNGVVTYESITEEYEENGIGEKKIIVEAYKKTVNDNGSSTILYTRNSKTLVKEEYNGDRLTYLHVYNDDDSVLGEYRTSVKEGDTYTINKYSSGLVTKIMYSCSTLKAVQAAQEITGVIKGDKLTDENRSKVIAAIKAELAKPIKLQVIN